MGLSFKSYNVCILVFSIDISIISLTLLTQSSGTIETIFEFISWCNLSWKWNILQQMPLFVSNLVCLHVDTMVAYQPHNLMYSLL